MRCHALTQPRKGRAKAEHLRLWAFGFAVFMALCNLRVAAQPKSDSLLSLPELTVRELRSARTGYRSWLADSLPLLGMGNLSERLLWENPVGIRPNAPGTLSTLSARGLGPRRSPVLWNGLNLQSPMNGVVDAALLPLWPGDAVELRLGGQSAAQSSGAMGGTVLITTPLPDWQMGWGHSLALGAGSWGRWQANAASSFSGKKWRTMTRASAQRADNDFPYQNTTRIGRPRVRQQNNHGERLDLQHMAEWAPNAANSLNLALWHQRAFREIPPTMTQALSETWQRDRATRALLNWAHSANAAGAWQTRAAFMDEHIAFFLNGQTALSQSRTAQIGSSWTTRATPATPFNAQLGGNLLRQTARADGYADSSAWYGQWRSAFFANGAYETARLRLSAQLRGEWAEGQGWPWGWSLGGQLALGPGALRLQVSRNFNLPTLNDRFWRSFGRADLRPERGHSADVGYACTLGRWQMEAAVFQLLVDDWIDWQPGADGVFRPWNLKKVWSRGAEGSLAWRWRAGRWQGDIGGRYQLVRSTNVAVYAAEAFALGRDLPYTPRHSGGLSAQLRRGGLQLAYLHQWTGRRFIGSDNAQAMPAYQLGNLLACYVFPGKNAFSLEFRLENCWDSPWQALQFRPMPGRGWQLGLRVRC
jgi:iron complex outermembrane receptor protein